MINVRCVDGKYVFESDEEVRNVWMGMTGVVEGQAWWTIEGYINLKLQSESSHARINILANGGNQNLICRFQLNKCISRLEDQTLALQILELTTNN